MTTHINCRLKEFPPNNTGEKQTPEKFNFTPLTINSGIILDIWRYIKIYLKIDPQDDSSSPYVQKCFKQTHHYTPSR